MGCYYITIALPGRKGEGMKFATLEEADLAYSQNVVDLHAKINVRLPDGRLHPSEWSAFSPLFPYLL